MENRPTLLRGDNGLALLLIVEVVALAFVHSPAERFIRYIGFDSGVDLTMQDLLARGFRPTVDFACAYGLLPLLINRAWYGIAGLTPGAYRAEVVLGTCLTAWGMARFARRAGRALGGGADRPRDARCAAHDVLHDRPRPRTGPAGPRAGGASQGSPGDRAGPGDGGLLHQTVDGLCVRVLPARLYRGGFEGGGTSLLGPLARSGGRGGCGAGARPGERVRGRRRWWRRSSRRRGPRSIGSPDMGSSTGRPRLLGLAGGDDPRLLPIRGRFLAGRVPLVGVGRFDSPLFAWRGAIGWRGGEGRRGRGLPRDAPCRLRHRLLRQPDVLDLLLRDPHPRPGRDREGAASRGGRLVPRRDAARERPIQAADDLSRMVHVRASSGDARPLEHARRAGRMARGARPRPTAGSPCS